MVIQGFYNLFGLALSPRCDHYSVRCFCLLGCLDWLLQVNPLYLSCKYHITPANVPCPKMQSGLKRSCSASERLWYCSSCCKWQQPRILLVSWINIWVVKMVWQSSICKQLFRFCNILILKTTGTLAIWMVFASCLQLQQHCLLPCQNRWRDACSVILEFGAFSLVPLAAEPQAASEGTEACCPVLFWAGAAMRGWARLTAGLECS